MTKQYTHQLSESSSLKSQLLEPYWVISSFFASLPLGTVHRQLVKTGTIAVTLSVICNLDVEFKLHHCRISE